MTTNPHDRRHGLAAGLAAYGLWGIVAGYWKLLAAVDAVEVLAHRALWGSLAFTALVAITGRWAVLRGALRDRRVVVAMVGSAALLAINWGVFVWSTVTGHLLEASLGYFINPLISVALGTLVLGERLRRLQWTACALAAIGVAILTVRAGSLPWISLVLALTFGAYGLVRKTAAVEAIVGSAIETFVMLPIAIGYLAVIANSGALGHAGPAIHALLVGAGVVTAVPLVLFTIAARRLPLSTVGFLQYLAPTGQFVLATAAFGEAISSEQLIAFSFIWVALAVFSIDLVRAAHR